MTAAFRLAGAARGVTERGSASAATWSRSTSSRQTGHSHQVADEARVLLVGQGAKHVGADVLLVHLVALEAHAGSDP